MSYKPTPETNSIIRNAQAADHSPTRLAATLTVKCGKLERERDEAIDAMKRAMDAYAKACKAVDDWRSLQRATKK